jgi:hypothetical protein
MVVISSFRPFQLNIIPEMEKLIGRYQIEGAFRANKFSKLEKADGIQTRSGSIFYQSGFGRRSDNFSL